MLNYIARKAELGKYLRNYTERTVGYLPTFYDSVSNGSYLLD